MLPVCEQDVFTRMHQIIKHHNEHQTYLADTIRLGTLATMETLVNTACKQLRIHLKSVISIDNDELPPIYTNRQEIADLAKCGPRTVYDHLERLRKVGLIRKVFRGRKHDFKVWINPWILLGAVFEPPVLIDLDSARNRPSTPAMRQISPLQNTLEGNNNLPNSGVESVDKLLDVQESPVPPLPRVRLNVRLSTLEREAAPQEQRGREASLDGSPGGGAAPVDAQPDPAQLTPQWLEKAQLVADDTGGQPAGSSVRLGNVPTTGGVPQLEGRDFATYKRQRVLTMAFWDVAREKFWPKQYFSKDHTDKILNLLWNDVLFGGMKCTTDQKSNELYTQRISQLNKAERFILRNKWPSVMPPLCYFSQEHYKNQLQTGAKGNFHHTTNWQIADDKQAAVVKSNQLIDQAIDSVLQLRPPRGYSGERTLIGLYFHWKHRLHREVNDGLLTERFHTTVSAAVGKLAAPNPEFSPQ